MSTTSIRSERVTGRKLPADLRTYVEGYLHAAHADHREFPGNTEIRYINEPYRWNGQLNYLVQYRLITKDDDGGPFYAKCSCELAFDDPAAQPTHSMTTKLELHNPTDESVLTYLTLGATAGCVQDVALVTVSDGVTITKLYPLQGTLVVPPNTTLTIAAPEGLGFNGNFSFGTPPLNCPCPDWPEGVALAEFIINNSFQPGGQETVDISCVCGANAFIGFDLSSDDWTTNGGAIPVKHIRNGKRFNNTGLYGVYPYGCDNCTASDSPPSCVGQQPNQVNALPICNVQRPAASPGGVVRVVFLGWTPVPL